MFNKLYPLIVSLLFLSCGSSVHTTSANKKSLSTHKNIAILPSQIYFGPKMVRQTDKFTEPEKQELQRYMSIVLQQHLYEMSQKHRKHFPFTVTIQPAETTNQILSSNKISFAQVFGVDKATICKILGVDAIIYSQTIFGKSDKESLDDAINRGSMASHISIYDSIVSTPLWFYDKELSKDPNNITSIAEDMPQAYYVAENKYQKVLIPWIPTIDQMFQSFLADFPYSK